jgi:hypothetical protein
MRRTLHTIDLHLDALVPTTLLNQSGFQSAAPLAAIRTTEPSASLVSP